MNHQNLWAPWRIAYLRELERRADHSGSIDSPQGSFLAEYWRSPQNDEANLVVFRNDSGIILLNRYPYANGHLLTALGDPRPTLLDYQPSQRLAFWTLIEIAMDLMQRTLAPQGVNVGINQGEAAGAGVPGHLHGHVVPRWNADTNFITVVGAVRIVPDALERMAEEYRRNACS